LGKLLLSLEDLSQPTIAAINGFAFGSGFELALACDIRIAVDQTLMGLPETKIGLIPGGGGTQRLPRLIGESRALELILTGRRITSLEAYQYGILSKVVSHEKLEIEAVELAEVFALNAPCAIKQAKYAIKKGFKHRFSFWTPTREDMLLGNVSDTGSVRRAQVFY
jgi:enoyl-CoA hydratase